MRAYINPIAVGILLSLFLIYFAFIPILIHQYRRYGAVRIRGNVVLASFVIYMITAWFMTVLPLPPLEVVRSMEPIQPNFKPFLFVKSFLNTSGFVLTDAKTWKAAICSSSFYTVAFNVVLTIPFGVYLRKYFKLSFPWVAALGLALSLFYEITQYTGFYGIYPQAYRFADVDDLIVNTLGAVLGFFIEGWMDGILPNPAKDRAVISTKVSLFRRWLSFLVDTIVAGILIELGQLVIYRGKTNKDWDLAILVISEVIVFILIPMFMKSRQTLGMHTLRLSFQDGKGQNARTGGVLLHNLFIGMGLHFIPKSEGMLVFGVEAFVKLLLIAGLVVFIVKSLRQRKVCYYWESWFDTYIAVRNEEKYE